ncbi:MULTISPECIES: chloride channel protein [Chryseobacterium]|uniref:H+/Cl- antiporter ClcA n=1 Tax=Chryseobacterium camelliae TaxID=1265445 RepID=A0ABU0TH42_9FLAO|nr:MULTISPECIES: chloride channel protein [Chryseobacterium]MDQ1096372.1 H+/Cl- antiporter ClcA [Chryseobacterium camelliae]MDQ1100311.1 H+/Cl- antiporter ClcA [Chryseobacterium sp. SORGH_AS_1048]MDR6087654.1 H+/Cl- antiporter ClcA [Chryseobacterium sp. SORGH_AS_0909]MDT3405822.1 H+/Cl- antiporter ClcA [Pseudacidovorax intermedius]
MLKYITRLRESIRRSFDNIRNEQLKHNLLQAIPFWIGSVITGFIAVMYAKIFAWGESLLHFILNWHDWMIFIMAPMGFVLSWWLVKEFAPNAKGSGIPQVMAAVELANPKEHRKIRSLLSLKIIVFKILSSVVLVIGGGAVGREGPTIQIAGSVFRKVNEYLPEWWPKISKKNMIMTGAAAGLAAAFNTPLGGIVFAVEELSKTHINYFKTALFTAVIIAGLTAQTLAGSYLYLGYPKTNDVSLMVMFPIILVAGIAGILASQLSVSMMKINSWKKKALKSDRFQIWFLIGCAMMIASVSVFISREILGSGKEIMERILFTENKHEEWYIPVLRILGPALSFTSGGAGGIFAPALTAGASIGSVISGALHLTSHETNVVVLGGMVAFLTGITRAPFTSAIIVLEMTDRHSLIFHLMLAGMISSIASILVSRHSLYDLLKMSFLAEIRAEDQKD